MSNPGVITLASLRDIGPNLRRLDVEDNIGEAIHVHLNGLRIDLTIREFLKIVEELEACDERLGASTSASRLAFDPYFLFRMGSLASQISKVEIQKRPLRELSCLVAVRVPGIGRFKLPKPVERTPAYLYLTGRSEAFVDYEQDAYPGMTNVVRLSELRESIRRCGYPVEGKYITLFGDQNHIRDGQHRAACLAAHGGLDQEIEVMVVHFSGRAWRLRPYLALFRGTAKTFVRKTLRWLRKAASRDFR